MSTILPSLMQRLPSGQRQSTRVGSGRMRITPKIGQTELCLWSATSEEIKHRRDHVAKNFPGGSRKVTSCVRDGLARYRFKFVKSGRPLSIVFDGLIFINDRWRPLPKPSRLLKSYRSPLRSLDWLFGRVGQARSHEIKINVRSRDREFRPPSAPAFERFH